MVGEAPGAHHVNERLSQHLKLAVLDALPCATWTNRGVSDRGKNSTGSSKCQRMRRGGSSPLTRDVLPRQSSDVQCGLMTPGQYP